ncbi:hypothetical protein HC931_26910 [Candidatus Gracilibacteria bacterium]|nr:hypothetical protein [Candidatus Gracilibacteria bacterium]NJP22218.1 hypothetical protein [Hydrococcus sp. CRU_1_1]
MGKEVRLISHNKISSYRDLCGWSYKDDEHDAVVCAYYGWLNLDNLSAYNRVRRPLVQAAYLRFLEKERIARDIRIAANRGWNLMHREFPEGIVKTPSASCERIESIWPFIAGETLTDRTRSKQRAKLTDSIGTAARLGFSGELISYAERVCHLHDARLQVKREFDSFLARDEYAWIKPVFDEFGFSTFERTIFLCQFDPFGQFLDARGKELRIELKRRKAHGGKHITRRIGRNKFHSVMGKAIYPWSSGNKEGHIVSGSQLARNHWYLWVNRQIGLNYSRQGNELIESFKRDYERDLGVSLGALEQLIALSDEQLCDGIGRIEHSAIASALLPLIEMAQKAKKSPSAYLKAQGKTRLRMWAKSRVADRAVKVLFKKLTFAYKQR